MEKKDSIRDTKYLPNALPQTVSRKLFVCYGITGWSQGEITVWDCDVSNDERCLLTTLNVAIEIPQTVDFKEKIISGLENEKGRVLAEAHMKAKELQEKIDELLQIEYRPMD